MFQQHPLHGEEMLRTIARVDAAALAVIVQHHEHLDGSGFPRRLREHEILPLAQILRVVDEYWTLVNPTDGRAGLPPNQALSELYRTRQQQLSDKVLTALVRCVSVYPPGTLVELSDHRIGMVVGTNPSNRLRPVVTLFAGEGPHASPAEVLDLMTQPDVTIVRALRNADLPPHLASAVDPQDTLAYLLCQPLSARHQSHGSLHPHESHGPRAEA